MRRAAWLSLLMLGSCLVSEDQYNAVKEERDGFRTKVSELEDQLDQAKGKIVELEKQLSQHKETRPSRPPDAQIASAFAELKLAKGDQLRVVLETTEGPIHCELFPQIAPVAVLNFVGLAEGTKEWIDPKSGQRTTQKLYDGSKFHRIVPGFMAQGGDPLGTGRGGPGYTFTDEVWPDVRFDRPGVLAMANSGPDTNGSQFFVTSAPQPHLNGRHTIFGVCDQETVQKMMTLPLGGADKSTPVKDVVLTKVVVERKPPSAQNVP